MDGYTLNQRRLQERGIEFEQAVNLLARTLECRQWVEHFLLLDHETAGKPA